MSFTVGLGGVRNAKRRALHAGGRKLSLVMLLRMLAIVAVAVRGPALSFVYSSFAVASMGSCHSGAPPMGEPGSPGAAISRLTASSELPYG